MQTTPKFGSSQLRLLALMYFSYTVTMLTKTSIVVVSPFLVSDPTVLMTKTQFGDLLAFGSFGGIAGKIIFGIGADKFGGKISFLVHLFILSIAVLTFGFTQNYVTFTVVYFCLALANAGSWPAVAKLIGNWYHPSQQGRAWSTVATASRTGAILATLGLGFLLNYLPWRSVLYISGSIGLVVVGIWQLSARERPKKELKLRQLSDDRSHFLYQKSLSFALMSFVKSPRVWLIFLAVVGLTIMVDFINFVPIFVKETLRTSEAGAVIVASAFPVGSIISVIIGGFVFDTLSKKSLARVVAISLGSAIFCLFSIYVLPSFHFSPAINISLMYFFLFVFGVFVAPAYYLPMSLFSTQYGGPFSGVLISLIDIGGFFASAVFGVVAGRLADAIGWSQVLLVLMAVGSFTLISMVCFLRNEAKWDTSSKKPSEEGA